MTTSTKKTKTKKEEPTMTVEEMRAALDGEEKMITLILSKASYDTPTFLRGKTPAEIAQYLYETARKEGFPDDFTLDHRSIPVTKKRRKYNYSQRKYVESVSTLSEGPYWVLVGYEPYTDEELLEKGMKLVAAKQKRDAAAAKKLKKKVDDFNLRARELGQPTITVEDLA